MFRRGWRLVRGSFRAHPVPHILGISGANVFAVAVVGFTVVIGRVTDEVIVPGLDGAGVDGSAIVGGMVALVVIGLIRGTAIMARRWFNMMAVARTQRTWRLDITDRYLDVPVAFHRARPAGELLAHADNDVEVASAVLMPLAFSMSVVALVAVSLISLLVVPPLFALVAVLLFPILAVLNRTYTNAVEAPSARAQEDVGRVSAIAHESLDGVLVVKTLGREDQEVARLAAAADDLRRERIEVGRRRADFAPVIYSLPNLGIIVLLFVGTMLVDRNAVTIGEMVRAMALFSILSLPMEILGFLFQSMPASVVAKDRINGVLAVHPEARPADVPEVVEPVTVEFDDVGFRYPPGDSGAGAPAVLDGLSFRMAAGETVALVGATGSGKSTAVTLLAGLEPATAGRVLVGDIDTVALGPDGVGQVVVPVFQESFLFADTIRQNLLLDREVPDGEIQRLLRVVEADGFVADLPQGLDTVVGERGVTLSGGQRQRLAIARALLRRPRVMVLDDATSAVDPTIEAAILENLRAHRGRTLLIIAHRLATIRLADRVLFLDGGRIAAEGTHDELLGVPAYAALARAYEEAGT